MSEESSFDSVRVAVRVRPLSFKEVGEGCENAVESSECGTEIRIPSIGKRMTYDHAFSPSGSQAHVRIFVSEFTLTSPE